MSTKEELLKNGSGYYDPTAYEAICRVDAEQQKVKNIIKFLHKFAHKQGYSIEGRIVLKNKKTGRTWK